MSKAGHLELRTLPVATANGLPPLLFLPGAFHGAWAFERWLPYFADRGFSAWALSYRGHGASGGGYAGAALADYLADIQMAIASLGTSPVLIGHSMGGLLIQFLLSEHKFPASVLVAPVPHTGIPLTSILRLVLEHPVLLVRSLLAGDMKSLLTVFARHDFFSARMPENERDRHTERMGGESLRAYLQMGPLGPRPVAIAGRTPVLVLAASEDRNFTPRRLAKTAAVWGGDLEVVAGSGHEVMLDMHWRDAAELIEKWIRARC